MSASVRHEHLGGDSVLQSQRCSRCGSPFRCGMLANDAACWCAAGPTLPKEALSAEATCMCPSCLDALRAEYGLLS